ncbi:MAG: PIN domain-containing protein [Spirochaetes bacterium]|nr:PIN domain-containing protein [Spirochaetota bacterium]
MSGNFFLDTNVIVYSFDEDPKKEKIADAIIAAALLSPVAVISFQVIQEFCRLALRKFKSSFSTAELEVFCRSTLYPICKVYPSFELLDRALHIYENHRINYFDALIVSAAVEGRCKYLLTEDMNDGQTLEGVTILNPFSHEKRLLAALPQLKLP